MGSPLTRSARVLLTLALAGALVSCRGREVPADAIRATRTEVQDLQPGPGQLALPLRDDTPLGPP